MGDGTRTCVDCGEAVTRSSPKVVRCDPCRLERKRALNRESVRRCHATHREQRAAYGAAWRKANPGYDAEWRRRRAEADPTWADRRRQREAEHRRRLLERDPDYFARWARQNPETGRRSRRARRARKLEAPSEAYSLSEIAERDGWRCQLCGRAVSKTAKWPDRRSASIDHIIPLSQGGSDLKANVQLAHFGCNSSKNNRHLESGEQLRLFG